MLPWVTSSDPGTLYSYEASHLCATDDAYDNVALYAQYQALYGEDLFPADGAQICASPGHGSAPPEIPQPLR